MTERLHFHFSLSCIGEGNGNPLQCSCLENHRYGGAWLAAVYGVAQSRTWQKRLSSSSSSNVFHTSLPKKNVSLTSSMVEQFSIQLSFISIWRTITSNTVYFYLKLTQTSSQQNNLSIIHKETFLVPSFLNNVFVENRDAVKYVLPLTLIQFSSVSQSCPTLCHPMNHSTPGLPVHHQLPEFTQTHVHRVHDAIQPSHPLSSPSPPAPNPSQQQSIFQWVNSSHEVAKVLEFQD